MENFKFSKIRPKKIVAELRRRDEEYYKQLEQIGFEKESIEEMKIDKKYKLDYPSNIYYQVITDAISEIFHYSDRIHRNVLYEIVKGLTELNIDFVFERFNDNDARMKLFCEKIMEVVIEKMEILYYFYEDEIFSELIFTLCNILDLDLENYGFTKTE